MEALRPLRWMALRRVRIPSTSIFTSCTSPVRLNIYRFSTMGSRFVHEKKPGLLFVKLQPKACCSPKVFEKEWQSLPDIACLTKENVAPAHLWEAVDSLKNDTGRENWMATFELRDTSLGAMTGGPGSEKWSEASEEATAMIDADARLFDFVSEDISETNVSTPKISDSESDPVGSLESRIIVAVSISLLDNSKDKLDRFNKWYVEEHIPLLAQVPGWLRTRRYITSPSFPRSVESDQKDRLNKGETEYLALHEYHATNGLDGPEFVKATTTPWNDEIKKNVVREKRRRVFQHCKALNSHGGDFLIDGSSPHGQNGSKWDLERGFFQSRDGVSLSYSLYGSSGPNTRTVVLCNSILTSQEIWDSFISAFYGTPYNSWYRFLRYNARGTGGQVGKKVTIDTLANDIVDLLDHLEVSQAEAVMGVSLGGITALNFAMRNPDRTRGAVICDTNAKSPEDNARIWTERIAVAEAEASQTRAQHTHSEESPIVGKRLAELTARRWFTPQSWNDQATGEQCQKVQKMIETSSLEGFKGVVPALWNYDVTPQLQESKLPILFIAGAEDGKLPGVMKDMAAARPGQYTYAQIDRAGHLPMVENPKKFTAAVAAYLSALRER